ncbi:methylcobamide:CoM methyltransferase MtaA [Methanolapillus ohkumae]|uniref:Uroporphyrinogen decarboxylase n=1 Tax=Methanolapillus ohkumae TaxID=3028298 RepID=A0AA96V9J8_9EURY|nr:Uroporphyrinogen decarboxylase [Methanosarcinaceae archaeon Am2]
MTTLKENLLKALNGEPVEKTPVVSVTQTGIVELMDLVNAPWPESQSNAKMMADLAVAAHELGGLEAVRVPYCLTVLAQAMGCEVNMGTKNRQPSVTAHPYEKPEMLDDAKKPDLKNAGRIPAVLEAIRLVRQKVGPDVPIIGGMEGPITLASDLCSVKSFMKWSIKKPDDLKRVIDFANVAAIEYANLMVEAGADIICIADPVSSPDLMSPQDFHDKLMGAITEFADKVKAPVVLHVCGNVTAILNDMADCHCKGLSIEEKVEDVKGAVELTKGRAVIIGNVSSPFVLLSGDPAKVAAAVNNALDAGVAILAPGCGIAPMTPLANIKAMVDARNKYFQK